MGYQVGRFNTQPPKGGWKNRQSRFKADSSFNTQPPKGGWVCLKVVKLANMSFNTQPPKGGWHSPKRRKS